MEVNKTGLGNLQVIWAGPWLGSGAVIMERGLRSNRRSDGAVGSQEARYKSLEVQREGPSLTFAGWCSSIS